jgi:hypothetical protein
MPQIGDKVKHARSEMVYEISSVSPEGDEVNLHVPGTNLERFRVRTESLTFVERKPRAKTSNPFTSPEAVVDAGEVMERIDTVQLQSSGRDCLRGNSRKLVVAGHDGWHQGPI